MAKNPNKRPDKGFLKEISKVSYSKPATKSSIRADQPILDITKKFDYKKPISKVVKVDGMKTPARMANYRESKPKKDITNICGEHKEHVLKRRGVKV